MAATFMGLTATIIERVDALRRGISAADAEAADAEDQWLINDDLRFVVCDHLYDVRRITFWAIRADELGRLAMVHMHLQRWSSRPMAAVRPPMPHSAGDVLKPPGLAAARRRWSRMRPRCVVNHLSQECDDLRDVHIMLEQLVTRWQETWGACQHRLRVFGKVLRRLDTDFARYAHDCCLDVEGQPL